MGLIRIAMGNAVVMTVLVFAGFAVLGLWWLWALKAVLVFLQNA